MTGQSNMSGRAPLTGAPTFANARQGYIGITRPMRSQRRSSILRLSRWMMGLVKGFPLDTQNLFGPQLAFADKMVTHLNEDVGIISSPKGRDVECGLVAGLGIRSPYGIALCRARRVIAAGHTIAGICHYQGESDGAPSRWVESELYRLRGGDAKGPPGFLPVVFCRIRSSNPSGSWPAWNEVWAQQIRSSSLRRFRW